MSASPAAIAKDTDSSHARYLQSLPRRTYALRVFGLGLGSLAVFAVLYELDAGWPAWAWAIFACLLWPHLARLLALRSRDPFKAELRNFVFDSALAGSLVPLMHFNVLPSVVLLAVVGADKLNTGVRRLWLRSLPGMFLAMGAMGLLLGFPMHLESSLLVIVASLPILVIHTLAVALTSYRLVRKVQQQNVQLEALSRIDTLTGVSNRSHWEPAARALLASASTGHPVSLLVIDIDDFKVINDAHGHLCGDDVLRALGAMLLEAAGAHGIAGRLGGDEFALAIALDAQQAEVLADQLRSQALALRVESEPTLRCSISLGVATVDASGTEFRAWREAADRAMYRAKQRGRNRSENGAEEALR
jgi:diguanylate cyclase